MLQGHTIAAMKVAPWMFNREDQDFLEHKTKPKDHQKTAACLEMFQVLEKKIQQTS